MVGGQVLEGGDDLLCTGVHRLPPSTSAATPRLAKTRAMPGPGETATTAIWPGSMGAQG
jgi:hypothetical protein